MAELLPDVTPSSTILLEPALCCLCGIEDVDPIGVGEDFEHRTSRDSFLVVRCRRCRIIFLNPRPASSTIKQIYPNDYHTFQFQEKQFDLIYNIRRRFVAKRLLKGCGRTPKDAKILVMSHCDSYHLQLLKDFGPKTWNLVGIDGDERAVLAGQAQGLPLQKVSLEESKFEEISFGLIFLIMTIEQVSNPKVLLRSVYQKLKPGGKLVVVTNNTRTTSSYFFQGRHWGGYDFPRRNYLFNEANLVKLVEAVGLKPIKVRSTTSPVNWVRSVRNLLDDWGFSKWLVRRFALRSATSMTLFTFLDAFFTLFSCGSILQGIFQKPE